jgi:hypothetical protein
MTPPAFLGDGVRGEKKNRTQEEDEQERLLHKDLVFWR